MKKFKRTFPVTMLASAGLVCFSLGLSPLTAVAKDVGANEYPSWGDVKNAQNKADDAQIKAQELESGIQKSTQESAVLSLSVADTSEDYAKKKVALDAARQSVAQISEEVRIAEEQVNKNRDNVGAFAAQAYKSGAKGLGFFSSLPQLGGSSGLQSANLMKVVADDTSKALVQTQAAAQSSRALKEKERQAQEEQAARADAAAAALRAAKQSYTDARMKLDTQEKDRKDLEEKLAYLHNNVASLKDQYEEGERIKREKAEQERKAAIEEAARAAEEARNRAVQAAQEQARAAQQTQQQQRPSNPTVTPPPAFNPLPPIASAPVSPGSGRRLSRAEIKALAAEFIAAPEQQECLVNIAWRESSGDPNASNPTSQAYGLMQALPKEKMYIAGPDISKPRTQVKFGVMYTQQRYGSACGAWSFWQANHWY